MRKHIEKISHWANVCEWQIFLIGMVIIARIPTLFTPHYYGDEEIYFVMGRAWRTGVPMYQEVFDHKPPLIYILAGLAENIMWYRLMLLVVMVIHTILFYKLARIIFRKIRPRMAYLASLIFVILTTLPTFEGNIANAELFMMLPVTLMLLMTLEKPHTHYLRYLVAGLVGGVGWLFKVPVIADFAAVALFLFLFQEKSFRNSLKGLLKPSFWLLVLGFVAPLALTFAYYYLKGHGPAYLETVLTVNLGYVSSWSTSEYAFNPFKSGLFVRAMITGSIALLIYLLRNRMPKYFSLIALWFAFSLFGALLSGRPYPHYLHQPFVPLSLLIPFIFILERASAWIVVASLVAYSIYAQKVVKFWHYSTIPIYSNFVKGITHQISKQEYIETFDGAKRNYAIGQYLNERLLPDDQIFVWGSDTAIYNITDRLPSGGKYMVDFHVRDFRKFDYVIEQLQVNKPKFVVMLPGSVDFPQLEEYLLAEYLPTFEYQDSRVFIRRPE